MTSEQKHLIEKFQKGSILNFMYSIEKKCKVSGTKMQLSHKYLDKQITKLMI